MQYLDQLKIELNQRKGRPTNVVAPKSDHQPNRFPHVHLATASAPKTTPNSDSFSIVETQTRGNLTRRQTPSAASPPLPCAPAARKPHPGFPPCTRPAAPCGFALQRLAKHHSVEVPPNRACGSGRRSSRGMHCARARGDPQGQDRANTSHRNIIGLFFSKKACYSSNLLPRIAWGTTPAAPERRRRTHQSASAAAQQGDCTVPLLFLGRPHQTSETRH